MSKFRTITDLKSFSDNEYFEPDTSETEPGQAVNIKSVYLRCMRGEMPPVRSGDYDIKSDMSVDDAFSTLDVTQSEGFDLADATAIANHLANKIQSEELSTTQAGATSSIVSDGADAVVNSEVNPELK